MATISYVENVSKTKGKNQKPGGHHGRRGMCRMPGLVEEVVGVGFSISSRSFLPAQLAVHSPAPINTQECSMNCSRYCKVMHCTCTRRAGQLCVWGGCRYTWYVDLPTCTCDMSLIKDLYWIVLVTQNCSGWKWTQLLEMEHWAFCL